MTKYGVTDNGFVRKRLDAILSDMVSRFEDKMGVKISKTSTSVLYQLFGIVGYELSDIWSGMQDTYNSMYPNTSSGVSLTNTAALAAIHPIAAEKTQVYVTCIGSEGTVIPEGQQLEDKSYYTYSADADTTITKTACSLIRMQLTSITTGVAYSISIDGATKTYTAASGDTASTVLAALYSQFSFTDRTFSLSNNILTIEMNDQSQTMNVETTEIQINSIGTPVKFLCDTYGSIDPEIGGITTIVNSITGLESVYNYCAADVGRANETDIELRQRWATAVYSEQSSSMAEAIQSAIYNNVNGVTAVKVFENTEDETDTYGRPPHCIEAVVEGGENENIAKQILAKKASGIKAYGSVSASVEDSQGISHTISFNRPTEVPVWIKAVITKNSEESWTSQNLTEIASYLLATGNALTMGEDVILQRFLGSIYSNLAGISYIELTATTGATAGVYGTGNIAIAPRELATFSAARIEVTLNE